MKPQFLILAILSIATILAQTQPTSNLQLPIIQISGQSLPVTTIYVGSNFQPVNLQIDLLNNPNYIYNTSLAPAAVSFNCSTTNGCTDTGNGPYFADFTLGGDIAFTSAILDNQAYLNFNFSSVTFNKNHNFQYIYGVAGNLDFRSSSAYSLPSQLFQANIIDQNMFSVNPGLFYGGNNASITGNLTLGSAALQTPGAPYSFTTIAPGGVWAVNLSSVSFSNSSTPLNQTETGFTLQINLGNAFTELPQDTIESLIFELITMTGISVSQSQGLFLLSSCPANNSLPDLKLTFNNISISIPQSSYIISGYNTTIKGQSCMLGVLANQTANVGQLGWMMLSNFVTLFNVGAQTIGFSSVPYTPAPPSPSNPSGSNTVWIVLVIVLGIAVLALSFLVFRLYKARKDADDTGSYQNSIKNY